MNKRSLHIVSGELAGHRLDLSNNLITIGRGHENTLSFSDGETVSKNHAQIYFENGNYIISDIGSTNGVYINQRRIGGAILKPGDIIQIGKSQLQYEYYVSDNPESSLFEYAENKERNYISKKLNQYEISQEIGAGGMATVYKAIHVSTGEIVAIKIPHFECCKDPENLARIQRELELGLTLDHPNVVKVKHVFEENGIPCMVMEYICGRTLRKAILESTDNSLPYHQAIQIIHQIGSALQYAHSSLVIHRDVKPENIFITDQNVAKLGDFGIAKNYTQSSLTLKGTLIGTTYYMSPEQAQGVSLDQRSDIYSLGIVFYEILTGFPPFTGEPLEVLTKHLTENPIPPSRLKKDVPSLFENVIMKSLEKNPGRRYQNIGEMLEDLLNFKSNKKNFYSKITEDLHSKIPFKSNHSELNNSALIKSTAKFYIAGKEKEGLAYILDSNDAIYYAGRSSDNNISFSDDFTVSRKNTRIIIQDKKCYLEDLNSTNGTIVNGKKIKSKTLLHDRDEICIGKTILKFSVY